MQEEFRQSMAELENEHWWYRARRTILEEAVDRFVGNTPRSLTIGVGATREAEMLAKRTRLVAIDRAPINRECVEFSLATQADALALPFTDGAFDAVFIFDVLEHLDHDDVALKEIHRVLSTKGRLLMTVPAFMLLFGRQDVVSEHKRRYRRGPLSRLLEQAGFEVEYASYFNSVLFPPIAAVRLLRRVFPEKDNGAAASDFDMRLPKPIERTLESLFAIERHAVGRAQLPFGVSILCSARRH